MNRNYRGRRSIRHPHADYTADGMYFITLCTHKRAMLFGEIANQTMTLSEIGKIVDEEWHRTPQIRNYVTLDAYVIMPNHLHGLIIISHDNSPEDAAGGHATRSGTSVSPINPDRLETKYNTDHGNNAASRPAMQRPTGPSAGSIGAIMTQFKGAVTRRMRRKTDDNLIIWQRNYYEHIVRDEASCQMIRAYIETNVARWTDDSLYCSD